MTYLEKLIIEEGPILSGELIESLIQGEKPISNDAARKRLSRLKDHIGKLKGLFSDRQILFYNKEIYGSEKYYSGLERALKKSGKQYYTIIQALDFHYGYVNFQQLAAYTISPVEKLKGHVKYDSALTNLYKTGLISIDEEYIVLLDSISTNSHNFKHAKSIEFAKNFVLYQFDKWSKNIGLVSFKSSKFHSEFGKYQFNFVAPSYIGSLPRMNEKTIIPAFIVADVLIGNVINEKQIDFFINKIQVLKHQNYLAKFIPFLIVDSVSPKALNYLKSHGVVVGFIDELFGEDYKELLNSLINLLTNAAAILKTNPEYYLDLMDNLNKLVSGKTFNLRGDLFELAVGYYQGRICNTIDIGKHILLKGDRREIDVFGVQTKNINICECKGYNHPVGEDEVDKWLGKNIPVIRKWILDQPSLSERKLSFQFWSTGGFTKEAIELLEKRKNSTTKYSIEYFNLEQMLIKSEEINSKKFSEILMEYYVKET